LRFAYSDRADSIALNGLHESLEKRRLSYRMLASDVGKLADAFKIFGIKEGDVVGAWMPNIPETVTTMLACTSLGGVFTSTSCDFGVEGVIDRFGQTNPKILVACAAYTYNGKKIDLRDKLKEIAKRLP